MKMTPIEEVDGAYLVNIKRFEDERGFFEEVYSSAMANHGFVPRQVNLSRSSRCVVRGMHVAPFAKLAMCVRGRLWDVVADVRPDSPTYLGWYGKWMTPEDPVQLLAPAGCAHGFFAAEDETHLLYLQTDTYDPNVGGEVHWRDPQIAIDWPKADNYILSEKDRKAKFLDAAPKEI